jgi:DNA-binding transcriptional regulator YiaG
MTPDELKNFRKRHKLTQAALAAMLHVHRVTLANWETGAYIPDTMDLCMEAVRASLAAKAKRKAARK